MTGNIYIIKNLKNKKVYIGKTFNTIQCRFKEHLRESRKNRCENRKLYKAIKKHGEDMFYVELLEENIPDDLLNQKEIEYIDKYDSYRNGYNSTLGEDGSRYLNINEEELIIDYHKTKSVKHTAKKFNISQDTVSLILHNNKIKIYKANSKKIKIIDLGLEFESLRDCEKYLIENNYSNSKTKGSIGINIKRSIKENKTYLKMKFEILD